MSIYDIIANPAYTNKHVLEVLLCHHLNIPNKASLLKEYDRNIPDDVLFLIKKDYERYSIHKEPLEYIIGYGEFCNRRFYLNPDVLIPRPETEYMIQAVVEEVEKVKREGGERGKSLLIDVGTGCGVLGISCFLETKNFFENVYLTDICPKALAVAKENVHNLIPRTQRKKVKLIHSNLLDFLLDDGQEYKHEVLQKYESIVLVANLPYIPEETFDTQTDESVRKREPRIAFVGGSDGLDLYRKMLTQLIEFPHKAVLCFFELMTWQIDILRREFGSNFAFGEVKTFHFQIRIVRVTKK